MITREDIATLFERELDAINDEHLRSKVIEAWYIGCQRGNWTSVEQLERMPFTLLTETHGINFIEHTRAVTWGAYYLAQVQKLNYRSLPYHISTDRLMAGGLLHDVGKLLEIEPVPGAGAEPGFRKSRSGKCARHPISGAILAAEAGLDEEVVNIIACHAKEGDGRPQVIETILIHQADFATFDPLVMKQKGQLIE